MYDHIVPVKHTSYKLTKKKKNYEKIGKSVLTNRKGSAIIKFAAKKWWR